MPCWGSSGGQWAAAIGNGERGGDAPASARGRRRGRCRGGVAGRGAAVAAPPGGRGRGARCEGEEDAQGMMRRR